jgi:hypothetical protein
MQKRSTLLIAFTLMACSAMAWPGRLEAKGPRGGGGGGGRGGGIRGGPAFSGGGFRGPVGGVGYGGAWGGRGWYGGGWYGGRWGYGRPYGWGGWGFGLGYWGFPYWWYASIPFWYAPIAYGLYVNPYYTTPYDYGGFNYGVPFPQQPPQNGEQPQDNQNFAAARGAFYAGNYPEALRYIERATMEMPGNPDIHQFHSLIFFAMGDYLKAAAVAHDVLEAGPGWSWSVLQSFYPTPDVYTNQLRGLERYITAHGDQAATRFLLGYQYLMLNHLDSARRQFTRVTALEPRDTLAAHILTGLNGVNAAKPLTPPPGGPEQLAPPGVPGLPNSPGGMPGQPTPPGGGTSGGTAQPTLPGGGAGQPPSDNQQAPSVPIPTSPGPPPLPQSPAVQTAPVTPPPVPQPVTPAPAGGSLVGTWKASPAPGVAIETTFQPDGHFVWKFSQGGQSESFNGTYAYKGDSLVFIRQDGEKMDGTGTLKGNSLHFRLKNTDPADPGLDFSR